MNISIDQIIKSTAAEPRGLTEPTDMLINEIAFDTRKIIDGKGVLFLSLAKHPSDLILHIKEAFNKGVRIFLVPDNVELPDLKAAYLSVPSVLNALQQMAGDHRQNFNCPVIGITGSNGKTIIKEWLSQLISHSRKISKSPASYNSQLGVPLSVLRMNKNTETGIFEAGISTMGEMENLQKIIRCNIGILSNIGDAHDDGFESREQKLEEKLRLFKDADSLIFHNESSNESDPLGELSVTEVKLSESLNKIDPHHKTELISWSFDDNGSQYHVIISRKKHQTEIQIQGRNNFHTTLPFTDHASIHNGLHVIICCLEMGIDKTELNSNLQLLEPVSMRLVLKKVSRNCLLIDDSYNADLTSLENALDFAHEQKKERSLHVIMSDFEQLNRNADYYKKLSSVLEKHHVNRLSYIGQKDVLDCKNIDIQYHAEKAELQKELEENPPKNEIILIKGARKYRLDKLIGNFELQTHKTQLHISLDAIRNNIQHYRSISKPGTKIMSVIKASAYGSDSIPLAKHLLRCGVEYLAVAYFDEAIELRKEGISAPIMIMNPDPSLVYLAEKYDLELEVYSLKHLQAILDASQQMLTLHLKIDSGMHRLGFIYEELDELISILQENNDVKIESVFSHFSCSEDPSKDEFTKHQFLYYRKCAEYIKEELGLTDLHQHICNSSAALRFSEYHMDMIRLGIGLYGYADPQLYMAHKLTSYVAQIKHLVKGDSVGYNRSFVADKSMRIATINIGYADGLSRKLGNGAYNFLIQGKKVSTIGNISMDTCAVDISGIEVEVGDEVVIYENIEQFNELARVSEQTAYEIISHTGPRVVRNYHRE